MNGINEALPVKRDKLMALYVIWVTEEIRSSLWGPYLVPSGEEINYLSDYLPCPILRIDASTRNSTFFVNTVANGVEHPVCSESRLVI